MSDERGRATDERGRATDEKGRATDERGRATDERKIALDVKIASDEKATQNSIKPITDLDGYIFYPSIYRLNYEDIITTHSDNFILESPCFIDLELWRNSFNVSEERDVTINHRFFSKLLINLQKSINGPLCMAGRSFSKQTLNMGTFYFYYIQFLANHILGHPAATAPFKNDNIIKQKVFNIIDSIIDSFYDKKYLDNLILSQFLKEDSIIFSEHDIVQFKVTIVPPKISLTKILKIKLPTTNWFITLRMNQKKKVE